MSKERVETLANQTEFLLEGQKELLNEVEKVFGSLLLLIDEKSKGIDNQADVEDLKIIKDYIQGQKETTAQELMEDVDFLKEQLRAINEIKAIQDPIKAKELLNMLIDPEEKLSPMQDFKDSVKKDLALSKTELTNMFYDLKGAFQEEKIHDLRLMLEAVGEEDCDDSCNDSCCQDSDEDESEKSCCSSCQNCSSECGLDKDDEDIFKALDELEQDDDK